MLICVLPIYILLSSGTSVVFGVYGNDAYVIPFAYNNTSNIESEIFKPILFFLTEFNKTSS